MVGRPTQDGGSVPEAMAARLRMVATPEANFDKCLQQRLWGSKTDRLKDWRPGDLVVFSVDKRIAGLAEVDSDPFKATDPAWTDDDDVYPHRVRLKFSHAILAANRPPTNAGQVKSILKVGFDPIYGENKFGLGVRQQAVLPEPQAKALVELIRSRPNDIRDIQMEPASHEPTKNPPEVKRRFWIEKTHVKGHPGREQGEQPLGVCLWSPQKSKDGRKIYGNMRFVNAGDVILHLIDDTHFAGVSLAADKADDTFGGVPNTGWGEQPSYRIPLKEFEPVDPPLDRERFFGRPESAAALKKIYDASEGEGLFYIPILIGTLLQMFQYVFPLVGLSIM